MPTAGQILNGIQEITNNWKHVSLFWHVYFGILILIIAIGIRPSRRIAGLLLSFPLFSVSIFAWLTPNPVNGVIFAIVGIIFLLLAMRLPSDRVKIAPTWFLIPCALLFAFGWFYPHFLETGSYLPYLYAAPVGTVPCPTMIIVIGFLMMLDGLGSRKLGIILGSVGLVYGVMGVAYLDIVLDWALILGAALIIIQSSGLTRKPAMGDLKSKT